MAERKPLFDNGTVDEDAAWHAVVTNDRRADGAFVYAVRTTGIFCRPSCAARTPRRENVVFFARPAGAEAAGFRLCQRCRPNHPIGTPAEAAALDAGFSSPKPLYDRAPGAYRRGGAAETIRYALFDTALGVCLVAATDVGLCAVALGDAPDALEAELRREFPNADRVRADRAVARWAEPVLRYLAGAPGNPARSEAAVRLAELPLDLRGTAFQRRVWAALRDIPPGQTQTYGEVAARLGKPRAARAVAQACAQNRIALVVPCHRVVGSDGALRGYRWGPDRKRRLLKLEGSAPDPR